MLKHTILVAAVAGLVLALPVMFLGRPMAANAGILQEDYFTEDTLAETSFANDSDIFTLDTVNDELDFLGDGSGNKLSGLYNLDAGTVTGTKNAAWTLSFDVRASFNDLLEDNLIKIPLIGQNGNLLEIQLAPSGTNDFDFDIVDVGVIDGETAAVIAGLDQDTYYHVDVVINRSGSALTDYFGEQDLAIDDADFWVNGVLGMWGIDTTGDGADHEGWQECEIECHYGEEAGSFDNWVVRDEAYVMPEPATLALLGLGGLGILLRRKRR